MIKVNDGQDPYSVIGKYIRDHMTAIEDMIAVIEIDGYITNELFLVDMDADGYFVWESDWWEGEKNVSLVDFFPVSDAQKPSVQPNLQPTCNQLATDCISRQAAIDEIRKCRFVVDVIEKIKDLPSVQPQKGKWIRHFDGNEWYWYCSSCKEQWYEEDLWMGGNSFPNFCPNCGADMRPQAEELTINPCRGCPDYIAPDGCRSSGGCADMRERKEDG